MKRTSLLSIFFTICGLLSFAPAAATLHALQAGMEGPDFSLKTIGGATKTFSEVKGGKLTVLVFWSTWSSKSEKLLARMQTLHERYGDRGLSIIGVNVDEQRSSSATLSGIAAVAGRLKIGFPMLVDHGLIAFHDYGVIALPTTIIMDRDRVITEELSGLPLVGSEAMVDFISSTMEGGKAASAEAGVRPRLNKKAIRFYNMGRTTLKSKRMAETAEMWFEKAVETDPAFTLPRLGLAMMYLRRGETAMAQAEFKEALALEPGNPIALCESGMILAGEGNGDEGLALFEAARKAEALYAPCYYYAGYVHGKAGRPREAEKMFDEAEKVKPLDYKVFVYKGMFFEDQKDLKKAFYAYKKGLEVILQLN